MKKFSSDQSFLNAVYPSLARNFTDNDARYTETPGADGQLNPALPRAAAVDPVVLLPFGANAQTHVQVYFPGYWGAERASAMMLHFTDHKGWQCEERHGPPQLSDGEPQVCSGRVRLRVYGSRPPEYTKGKATEPNSDTRCFCRDAYLWWASLRAAEARAQNG